MKLSIFCVNSKTFVQLLGIKIWKISNGGKMAFLGPLHIASYLTQYLKFKISDWPYFEAKYVAKTATAQFHLFKKIYLKNISLAK